MSVPVVTLAQMRAWEEATWATGQTEAAVIAEVGKAVAQTALRMTRDGDNIVILAGKGHNGDDARAAEPHLSHRSVTRLDVTNPIEALATFNQLTSEIHLIVDGLFGIGLNRPLDNDWQRFIQAINDRDVPLVAIDTPSGLNAETGLREGTSIRATVTLTVGGPKRGLLTTKGSEFVGRLEVASNVGLIPCPVSSDLSWVESVDFCNLPPKRLASAHKGTFGHATIIAGSVGYHGAAVLATRGALRARPGLVSLITQENTYLPCASQLQAAMVHPWRQGQKLPTGTTSILFGPGLAADVLSPVFKNELRSIWNECPLPVIADASALDWLPQGAIPKNPVRVITPHPGEAARLLKSTNEQVQGDRPATLRELSKRYGNCWVVLKGQHTLTGQSTGKILVNSSGNPFLAQGGSGDVLAGYITGLLAQSQLQGDPAKTISFAVWQHGAAADALTERKQGWVVEDLVEALGSNLMT